MCQFLDTRPRVTTWSFGGFSPGRQGCDTGENRTRQSTGCSCKSYMASISLHDHASTNWKFSYSVFLLVTIAIIAMPVVGWGSDWNRPVAQSSEDPINCCYSLPIEMLYNFFREVTNVTWRPQPTPLRFWIKIGTQIDFLYYLFEPNFWGSQNKFV